MSLRPIIILFLTAFLLPLAACAPGIYGNVRLMDRNMAPVAAESPEGTVINMINTSVSVEKASHSVTADVEGNFESEKGAITKGTYKVEGGRIGYVTETITVEVGSGRQKVELTLKKIPESKRRSIESSDSDRDKIINPGEVNIQPPTM